MGLGSRRGRGWRALRVGAPSLLIWTMADNVHSRHFLYSMSFQQSLKTDSWVGENLDVTMVYGSMTLKSMWQTYSTALIVLN